MLPEKLIRDAAATVPNSGIPLAFRKRVNPIGDEKISAAGVLFVTSDGEALFLKRGGSGVGGHVGEWDLPGGGLDEGEEPVDAARRETLEEIGHLPHWDLAPLTRKTSEEGVDYLTFGQRVERKFIPKLNRNEHTDYQWAALDNPPQPLHPDLAEFLSHVSAPDEGDADAEDEAPRVCVNAEHDGPWFSVISLDGQTVYRNLNIPDHAELGDVRVPVDPLIIAHEVAERAELRLLLAAFIEENGCDPTDKEREAIYLKAHKTAGVPAERTRAKEMGVDWRKWNAWCRGEEAKVEKVPFVNPPEDADVKPIPHGHGELEATDAFSIALDRDSVRLEDIDGRLHVAISNISKANVCPYKGREIPDYEDLGLEPDKIYQLLRDPDELAKAASSFNRVQLLKRHVPVTADDHKPYDVVGTTGSDAVYEHPYLKNSLAVWEQDAIEGIKSREKVELSCGYHYTPDMTPGVYEGEAYDGVMRDIVGNHVALVEDGRAGPDVVVGDSSENVKRANVDESESLGGPLGAEKMPKPTKFANLALQLTASALKPVLAADAEIDLMPIFKDVNTKNFSAKKIAAAIGAAVKGKLAKDASVGHLAELLDHLEHPSSDESVSGPQHRAMEAAAHGNSTLGIPQSVGSEFSEADKGKSFGDQAAHLGEFLKGKGLDEETVKAAVDMAYAGIGEGGRAKDEDKDKDAGEGEFRDGSEGEHKREETAGDEDETEEERKAREAKEGKDNMPERTKTSVPTAQDKKAFDAAVKLAVDTALEVARKQIKNEVRESERAIRMALDEVRPYVGELPASLGYETATQVYRQALKMRGVDGVDDIHKSALPTILKLLPKAGAHAPRAEGNGLAMDRATDADLAKEYPGIENVLVG